MREINDDDSICVELLGLYIESLEKTVKSKQDSAKKRAVLDVIERVKKEINNG